MFNRALLQPDQLYQSLLKQKIMGTYIKGINGRFTGKVGSTTS